MLQQFGAHRIPGGIWKRRVARIWIPRWDLEAGEKRGVAGWLSWLSSLIGVSRSGIFPNDFGDQTSGIKTLGSLYLYFLNLAWCNILHVSYMCHICVDMSTISVFFNITRHAVQLLQCKNQRLKGA